MSYYERHLPHWHPEHALLFVTRRLHGTPPIQKSLPATPSGHKFAAIDRAMDKATTGPLSLQNPAIAWRVIETFIQAQDHWHVCTFTAWVLMPNHVHLLILPNGPLSRTTRAIKSTSARLANQVLGTRGLPFWQAESYDHWARNRDEANRIIRYIESNPVTAGFTKTPEAWPWSSASEKYKLALNCTVIR